MSEIPKPKADYVGHPAMHSYAVSYVGPFARPGKGGAWHKKIETWREGENQFGVWRWVRR